MTFISFKQKPGISELCIKADLTTTEMITVTQEVVQLFTPRAEAAEDKAAEPVIKQYGKNKKKVTVALKY